MCPKLRNVIYGRFLTRRENTIFVILQNGKLKPQRHKEAFFSVLCIPSCFPVVPKLQADEDDTAGRYFQKHYSHLFNSKLLLLLLLLERLLEYSDDPFTR